MPAIERDLEQLLCAQGNTPTGKGRHSFDQGNRLLTSSPAPGHPPSPLSRSSVAHDAVCLPTEANQSPTAGLLPASAAADAQDAGSSTGSSIPSPEAAGATQDIYAASHAAISRAAQLAVGRGIGSLAIKVPSAGSATADTHVQSAATASTSAAASASVAASAVASAAPSVPGSGRHSEDGSEKSAGSSSRGAGGSGVAGAPASGSTTAGGADSPAISALITVIQSVPPPVTPDIERRLKVTQQHCLDSHTDAEKHKAVGVNRAYHHSDSSLHIVHKLAVGSLVNWHLGMIGASAHGFGIQPVHHQPVVHDVVEK